MPLVQDDTIPSYQLWVGRTFPKSKRCTVENGVQIRKLLLESYKGGNNRRK